MLLPRKAQTGLTDIFSWVQVALILTFVGSCSGLVCWHCIAENCEENPSKYHRAERRTCLEGQTCQKVVFEMLSDVDHTLYMSTVRSCAEVCQPKNDYVEGTCTSDRYRTRGCVKRSCCSDDDLCNSSNIPFLRLPGVAKHILGSDFGVSLRLMVVFIGYVAVIRKVTDFISLNT